MSKFKIITFGCKVNAYESEGFKEDLLSKGFVEAKNDEEADICIVNTCAVTSTAERKCLQAVRRMSKANPNISIGVVGCSSQINKDKYLEISGVKTVYGNTEKSRVVQDLIKEVNTDNVLPSIRHVEYDAQIITKFGHEVRAFVKIQDGCDNFCSYCIIPFTRGNSRSRKAQDIVDEIQLLINSGYKEVVLTGIDMGSYKEPIDGYGFSSLLALILKTFDGQVRFRISSLEESQINEEVISLYGMYPTTLVPHLHIPLQSGSETILKAMRRKYDLKSFIELTNTLKRRFEYLALSTDVIVGFPGETEELFMETYNFIEKVGFMRLHVFPYSRRPGTLANSMKEQVEQSVKNDRVRRLIALGDKLSKEYMTKFIGVPLDLLIEEKLEDNKYRGYTQNYLDLMVESTEDLMGKMVKVSIDKDFKAHII